MEPRRAEPPGGSGPMARGAPRLSESRADAKWPRLSGVVAYELAQASNRQPGHCQFLTVTNGACIDRVPQT